MKELKKMTKKEKKEYYNQFRNTWTIDPATRREPKNKYKEKKYKERGEEKFFEKGIDK